MTGLSPDFWIFVAERERDIELFFYAAGSYRITPYYLGDYLLEDLGIYQPALTKVPCRSEQNSLSFRNVGGNRNIGENFSEIKSSIQ